MIVSLPHRSIVLILEIHVPRVVTTLLVWVCGAFGDSPQPSNTLIEWESLSFGTAGFRRNAWRGALACLAPLEIFRNAAERAMHGGPPSLLFPNKTKLLLLLVMS